MRVFLSPQDIADPFFAYCKQHADRFDRKWKRKNYLALQSYCKVSLQEREKQLTPEAQVRFIHSYQLQQPNVNCLTCACAFVPLSNVPNMTLQGEDDENMPLPQLRISLGLQFKLGLRHEKG